jgi:hypothetical protein
LQDCCAGADIRNSIFMTGENCIQAQIADKLADKGLKILIADFRSLEAQLRTPFY